MKKPVLLICTAVLAVILLIFAVWNLTSSEHGNSSSSHTTGTQQGLEKVDQRPTPTPTPAAVSDKGESASSSSASVSSQPEEKKTGTQDAPVDATGSVRGTIVDIATSTIIIKEENSGKELYFMRESADISGSLYAEEKVEIFYNGVLEDNNSLDLYVTRIVAYPS